MELLPTSSPVYGGGVIMTFLPEDYILPPSIRAFLVFKGSKEQQITEAGISYELNAFQAIIPDHEPPEDVYLSVYILFSSGDCKCIATEGFQFYLDQTCFLARYLADSIHNVESLEDWDCIRGEAFCLQKENFTTLDNRLTPAFKHLILPSNWNLLGGPEIRHVQRETLFHFAGRLGLVDFATFLLQKNGAEECLKLKNRSNELAASVARVHGNGDLAYLFSNPHKHKKPTWAEEAKWIYPESTIRRSNYDKMSITVRLNPSTGEKIPHTENQIQHFSRTSQPPQVSISYDLNNEVIDMEHHTQQQTTTTRQQHVQQQHYYDVDVDENEGIAGMLDEYCQERNIGLYAGTSSSTVDDYHPLTPIDTPSTSLSPPGYSKMDPYGSDVARQTPEEVERDRSKRISLSCPDLAQDDDNMKKDQIGVDTGGGDPRMSVPRNRSAIQVGLNDDGSDMEMRVGGNSELSPTRRHSWHSSESLHVDADVDDISPTINFTYPDEDVGRRNLQQSSSSVSEDIEMINSPTTNQLHGVVQRRNNEAEDFTTFAVINKMPTTVADALSQKQKLGMRQRGMSYPVLNTDNLSANDKQSATTEDRRYTICEGQQPNNSSSSSCINTTSTLAQQDHNLQSASHSTPYLNSTNDGPHQHLLQQRSLQETTTTKKNNEILPRSDHVRPPVPPKPKLPPSTSGMSVQILPHTSPIVEKSIPIVPPPPQPDPPEKKIITRKISFLKQLRSSKIKKTAKNKAKMQPPTVQEDDSDKNEVGSVDNKNSSNQQLKLKGHHHHHQRGAVGGNNGDVVGGQQRPQSMMINRPPQYPVGNPAGHRPQQRPQSTIYSSGRYGSNSVTNNSLDSVFQRPVSESPDEIEDPDDEFEEELLMKQNEAEAWSITVDKKTIKKMGKKDIKRQEIIYEFIQTERNYLATLIIMQKIFARGMSEELQLDPSTISKLFPYIDEHVKFVRKFVKLLLERQQDNKLVRRIGDLFLAHWSGSSGDEMKKLFGAFCSCNNEMNAMYKELNKNDKKFAAFVKKVKEDLRTKRKGIPECYLLVTQRITKYPIMVQTLLENTNKKENQEDHRDIEQALDLSRQIAKGVDEQVRDRERLLKLQDIHEKTDPRSSTIVKGRKFDRKDFFARNRKLSFCSDTVQLKVQRNKPIDVFLVVLSDCIVVLHENNGKYFFVTTTIAVLKLKKLILREVAYHNLGLLLINAASADMIEIRFSSSDLRKKMISLIRTAVGHCPEDGPDSDDDADSERQSQESKIKSEKWNELFTKLHEKDEQMAQVMEERINCFKQYQPHILSSSNIDGGDTAIFYPMLHHSKSEYDEGRLQFPPTAPLLQTLADFAGKLSNSMSEYNGEEDDDVNLLGNNISLSPKQQTNEQTTTSIMTSSSSSELLTTKHHHHQHGGSSDSSDTSPDISSAPKSSWVTGDSPTRDHVTSVENGGSMTSLRSYSTYHMLESMKQLSILCNNYISHAQQQDSYVAKLYSIMEQERSRKHKPGNLLEEAELKRNQVKQEEQLDELRKEQQKLKSQQDNFERYKERQMRNIEQQDKKLEEQKAELQRASDKNNSDRDEIQLQKEELQRELGRVRAMRKSDNNQQTTTMTSSLPGSVPPSSTSSTASLLMNKNNSSSNNQARSSSMSRVVMGEQSSSSSSSVTSSTRSSSLRAASPTPPSGSASGDYLRASKRGEMTSSSSAMSELPIHLQYSATNQMTAGRTTAQQQQLFTKNLSKLAKNDGKTSKESKHHHHHTKSSLSSKLSSLSSGGNQQQQTTNCNTTTGDSRLLMPPTTTTHRHHQKQLSEPQQLFAMRRPNSPRLLMSGGTSTNNLSTLRHLPYPTITTTASGAPPHMTSSSPPTSYPSSTTTADIGAATNIGRRSDAARRQSSASSSGSGPRLSAKRRGGHSTNSSDREEDIELFL